MRFWQADVLNELGNEYNVRNWTEAATLFRRSGEKIMKLCEAALKQDKQQTADFLMEIAELEERAYGLLRDL